MSTISVIDALKLEEQLDEVHGAAKRAQSAYYEHRKGPFATVHNAIQRAEIRVPEICDQFRRDQIEKGVTREEIEKIIKLVYDKVVRAY